MARILRAFGSAEVIGLLLVSAALQALTYGVASSLRNTDTKFFFWICLLSAIIAFGLSKRPGNGILASVWMIVLGLSGIWILAARLTSPLLDLGEAILALLPQIVPAIRSETPIDTSAIAEAWLIVTGASQCVEPALPDVAHGLEPERHRERRVDPKYGLAA